MWRVWMNRWASACRHVNRRPRQLHHPGSVLGRLLVDVWRPLPQPNPSIPAASSNTVVHEYGWQARIPGIINVPRGHINHITIKRPNAPKKCKSTRKKSRRQTVLERRDAGVLSVAVLLGDASARYIAPQLRSGVDTPKHLMWQGWMQLHACTVYLGRDVDSCSWHRKHGILFIKKPPNSLSVFWNVLISLHAVWKINKAMCFLMHFFLFFSQHWLKAKYMQMSTLAAGARTRGNSTVCWQPALSSHVLSENAQNALLSQSEKTFPPSAVFLNRKLSACDAPCGSCTAQCLVSPRTGPLHWGSRVAAAKTDGCPSKICLWLSVGCKGGAKSDQQQQSCCCLLFGWF